MKGKKILYIDQYGHKLFANTVAELKRMVGRGKLSRMYRDKADGRTVHVGYVIGNRWFTAFIPFEAAP